MNLKFSPARTAQAKATLALSAALACTTPTYAARVGDYTNRAITETFSYESYGGGDFIFRVTPAVAGCEGGFWMAPADGGYKTSVASALLALQSKINVRVWGYTEQLWSGSGSPTCKLDAIGLAW
jgi:hypothetical protein